MGLNYDLSGLVGFDMHGKTVGVVGSGKIGRCTAAILIGMGCKVLTFDPFENQEAEDMGMIYVSLDSRQIGSLGTDVYENEGGVFFSNPSARTDDTPGASLPREFSKELSALVGHSNVIVTPHMAFLTQDALVNIAKTTVLNLTEFAQGGPYTNQVKA